MPKLFSFDFDADDIDAATPAEDYAGSQNVPKDIANLVPPKIYSLQDVLLTFPSHISFGTVSIQNHGGTSIDVPRRDLHDIRAQLMAEDGTLSGEPVAGLSTDDIVPNLYEGGFKTWECSVDLAEYVCSDFDSQNDSARKDLSVVELGAGTALPSLTFLRRWLLRRCSHPEVSSKLQLCLTDYNRSVLELATIPNLYLVTQFRDQLILGTDVDSEPEDIKRFQTVLSDLDIDVSVISGSWTPGFVDLIPSLTRSSSTMAHETLILASETIYSPASTRVFTQVLLSLLRKMEDQGSNVTALVAAKRMYFGVGGGVDEFLAVLQELGGRGNVVWETQGAGVGRVIIAVTLKAVDGP